MLERRHVSRRGFVAAGFASCAAVLTGAPASDAAGARTGPWCLDVAKGARDRAYDFSLYLLDGKDEIFTLSALVGRPVWLQFFATWCGPCNEEAADVVRIATKYADVIRTVGIDYKETPKEVRAFRDLHKIPFPIALDDEGKVFTALGLHNFPTHLFLDARGVVSCLSVGDLNPVQMENEIAVALQRVPKPMPQAASTAT